jgi:RNA polymerase sigma-70 factor (ECF subfamily)
MSCSTTLPHPCQTARSWAERLLVAHGRSPAAIPGGGRGSSEAVQQAALATAVMDLFRLTGSSEVFECLVQLASDHLHARVRARLRFLGVQLDPNEVLQDAIINIFRYPDKFDACRPGAFAAWSSTIVDNTIRRQLRGRRGGPEVWLSPSEVLSQHADTHAREPGSQAEDNETCAHAIKALNLVLQFYLAAFHCLSERERFVLQMVEVREMRYADLATVLAIRPEALKMVVFRARKRIHDRLSQWLGQAPTVAEVAAVG